MSQIRDGIDESGTSLCVNIHEVGRGSRRDADAIYITSQAMIHVHLPTTTEPCVVHSSTITTNGYTFLYRI